MRATPGGAQSAGPALWISRTQNQVKVSWPLAAYNFGVETTTDLGAPGIWTNWPSIPSLNGGEASVLFPLATEEGRFFRLKAPGPRFVFQFAVFYDGLLEFTWAAPLTVRGPVHANRDIFVGSAWPLAFSDLVTTTGEIRVTNWFGHVLSDYTGTITYSGNPGAITNVLPLVMAPLTNGASGGAREIIAMPPPGEDVNSALGQYRYFNMAGMVLLISNTSVTAVIKSYPADPAPFSITAAYSASNYTGLAASFPFLKVTNTFKDQREERWPVVSQIDVGRFNLWASTNVYTSPTSPITKHPPTNPLNILYVADNRTVSATQFTAVRLTNGLVLATNGFTVATPNPLYVLGIYNCPNPTILGTTNTSGTAPAALISDALTILSFNWADSQSALALGSGGKIPAGNTTINAALMTGAVFSGPGGTNPFSGGLVNLPRLLEDWSASTLTINGSFVCLYPSARATGPWQSAGTFYNAPTRNFNFDQRFRDPARLPPGSLRVFVGGQ